MAEPLIADELWAELEPLLPRHEPGPRGGAPRKPDRPCRAAGGPARVADRRPVAAAARVRPVAQRQHVPAAVRRVDGGGRDEAPFLAMLDEACRRSGRAARGGRGTSRPWWSPTPGTGSPT